MPRTARASVGGVCYHVINRGNAQARVFHKSADYAAFIGLLGEAVERTRMRVLAYCLMPNHFHLVVWPRADGDLSRFMQWLLTSHVRRYHRHYGGSGHVWQGRFKAFPIQRDRHLLTVLRYVERNALRAKLVRRAEKWAWSSVRWWPLDGGRNRNAKAKESGEATGREDADQRCNWLVEGPVDRGRRWVARVNAAMTEAEEQALKVCVNRGTPFGEERWRERTARKLGLESTMRPRGRPKQAESGA